ncbi:hypothetical protein AYJ57_24880 (plasmid) [Salipiger sp. CCB-MM3]|uniref:amidase n=1 Tax=Salipiger sp. CCB-MM3 TaxID=1792508 RepID=UPI00080A97AA|nr:amidase [Salipiger sp. CCB-MM3]ANT63710.1 hypothetical protein AYJ57_24880 [Salipiger sp. CCB-MM3]
MTADPWTLTASELASAFRNGTLTPSEALASVLSRIEAVNPVLNLFAHLDVEGAKASAAEADARFANGTPLGAFDGVPVSVKDNITVMGMPCAWGSTLFEGQVPEKDETPVARLRAQGAVLLGKTNVSEFTMGRGNVSTLAFGTTRNPWNPELTPGASTGGGAAAVAAGAGPVTLGTDGGGSIRRPASYNNLVGLKPTTGRVARINGLPQILHDFEIIGPIARTVDDLAMTLSAIEGPHPLDRASFGFEKGEIGTPKPGARILYVPQFLGQTVEAPIAESCAAACDNLRALGYDVTVGEAPIDVSIFEKYWPMIGGAGLAWLLRDIDWEGKVGAPYPPMIKTGQSLSAVDYVEALAGFRTLYEQMATAFETYDYVMTPAAGAMPWKADEFGPGYHRAFTGFVNGCGLPAIAIPCDPAADGMPIGFQMIAPFGQDWDLVTLAKHYEEAHPWAQRRPSVG